MNKTVIGDVSVEVKATLSVDEQTARTCFDLIGIHARNQGMKGILLVFGDDGFNNTLELFSEAKVAAAYNGAIYAKEVKEND